MGKVKDAQLFMLIRNFLEIYLPTYRHAGENTVKSYRTGLNQYLDYVSSKKQISRFAVTGAMFSYDMVTEYLHWLSVDRKVSSATCNNRLAVIRAFISYAAACKPEYIDLKSRLSQIKGKKNDQFGKVDYMSEAAVKALMEAPDVSTTAGLTDQFMMVMLYDTGARIQEILSLRLCDLKIDKTPTAIIHGKGGKTRIVPLMPETVKHLKKYLKAKENRVATSTTRYPQGLVPYEWKSFLRRFLPHASEIRRFSLFEIFPVNDFIPVKIDSVSLRNFTHHPARVANGNHMVGDVARHNAACTDHCIFPDMDTGQNNDACANPGVLPDPDILVVLQAPRTEFGINRMIRRGDRHIRAEHHAVGDINMPVIHQGQVGIDIHARSQMQMMSAPVRAQRQLNIAVFTALRKHRAHVFLFLFNIAGPELIERPQAVLIRQLFFQDFTVTRVIDQSFDHSLILCHAVPVFV